MFSYNYLRKQKVPPSEYKLYYYQAGNMYAGFGVYIENRLTFLPNIDHIVKKAPGILMFVIIRRFETKIVLYSSLVHSIQEYCRPHFPTQSLRIELMFKNNFVSLGIF